MTNDTDERIQEKETLLMVQDKPDYYMWWAKRLELEENTHSLAISTKRKLSHLWTQSKNQEEGGKK